MSKFKKGDAVYLNKRGIMEGEHQDWTIIPDCSGNILVKNKKYIIQSVYKADLGLNVVTCRLIFEKYGFGYSEEHFIKYE